MKDCLVNAMEVEKGFTALGVKFEKGMILEFPNKHTIAIIELTDGIRITPVNLSAYSDPFINNYYDITRFVFENHKNLSQIVFRRLNSTNV